MSSHHPTYTMGALLISGGLMGFLKKKSVPSLIAGSTLGIGFLYAGYILQHGQMTKGHGIAISLSTLTSFGMGIRALKTKAKVPVMVSCIGIISTAYHTQKFFEWYGNE